MRAETLPVSDRLYRGRKHRAGAYIRSLRFLLRVINTLLAVIGIAMVAYALYMYFNFAHTHFPSSMPGEGDEKAPFPWFIYAFGGAGVFTFSTAVVGLIGVGYNSRVCLGLYSVMMFIMVAAQVAVAIAAVADSSWKKRLPHDDTGDAEKMEKFIKARLEVIRWVGLAVLIIQIFSIFIAYLLSSAQAANLEDFSEDEDEVWGRRRPLLNGSPVRQESLPAGRRQRNDPWSQRMREKYGLDTSLFQYDPEHGSPGQASSSGRTPPTPTA